MKKVLTIAGSDCSGGAGIQADLKTITVHKMYGMSVITALTAQNTRGVLAITKTDDEMIRLQLEAIFTDIFPDAIKIGMVSKEAIAVIVEELQKYKPKNIVLDPVMVATSGSRLLSEDAISALKEELMPLCTMITPNIYEAEILAEMKISDKMAMERACQIIAKFYKGYILLKGGHLSDMADDLLYFQGKFTWFRQDKIINDNTHGTGCTLSSALACNLAKGISVEEAVENSKEYISKAISLKLDLGSGKGPLNHLVSD